ncbi:MAG TPA: peptide chain release factor-like protein [Geomobilimonas sp.]|nr:peptide chain release factor-like protein [Geomobilimonas sp.]
MTNFAVSEEKNRWLRERMAAVGLREEDLEERFVRSSGAGGQHVNKTATCVWLRHRPTGLEVKCMADRSQSLNRFLARRELAEKLAALNGLPTTKDDKTDKLRRQKARRKRKATTKYTKPGIDRDTQDSQDKS